MSSKGLSLQSDETTEPAHGRGKGLVLLVVLLLLSVAGLGFLGYQVLQRMSAVERQLALVSGKTDESSALARQAMERAVAADAAARAAAEGRQVAEAQTAEARQQADAARQDAGSARETAARAQAEAERIRKKAEAEVNRLETALGQIAETRRTALGLVMNLGSDYLKFEFDKADLRPEDKELLSRVAGILMTSEDFTVSVNGHTDDVGTDAYNQKLSERRAESVKNWLTTKESLDGSRMTTKGWGETKPVAPNDTDANRQKNRRVQAIIEKGSS